jgi:hypothetical protein
MACTTAVLLLTVPLSFTSTPVRIWLLIVPYSTAKCSNSTVLLTVGNAARGHVPGPRRGRIRNRRASLRQKFVLCRPLSVLQKSQTQRTHLLLLLQSIHAVLTQRPFQVCCSVPPEYNKDRPGNTVGYREVPRDWKIWVQVSTALDCGDDHKYIENGRNRATCFYIDDYCVIHGTRYNFSPPKGVSAAEGKAEGKASVKCQIADTFVHEDGREYDISRMESSEISELLALAENSTATLAGVSGAFGQYKMSD